MYKKYSKVIASIFHIICYHESTTQYSTFGIPIYMSICRMPVTLFMQLRKPRWLIVKMEASLVSFGSGFLTI